VCGIAGIYNLNNKPIDLSILQRMTDIIRYRGPDDFGYLMVETQNNTTIEIKDVAEKINQVSPHSFNLGLGHRRLSILDLSKRGRQPMTNTDESLWITYNGEVYNYKELRNELELENYTFRTNTDTEVLMNSYNKWGEDCVAKFNGMFAFAIWDMKNRQLFCARDRFGIKPFYYYFDSKIFLFSSEIKQLLLHPQVRSQPNRQIIFDYLYNGKIDHSEQTFFENIYKLEPAHYLVIKDGNFKISRYWNLSPSDEFSISDTKIAYAEFKDLFTDAVRLRLRSDVPVGSCLSGGIDSSAIVCLMAKLIEDSGAAANINTFSITFADPKLDESPYIDSVIDSTGVNGHFVQTDEDALLAELGKVVYHQDEPFGSSSMLVQYSVMKLAQENSVKVLLDGQGADEIFAGYPNFIIPYIIDCLTRGGPVTCAGEIKKYASYKKKSPLALAKTVLQKILLNNLSRVINQTAGEDACYWRRKTPPPWMNHSFFQEFYQKNSVPQNRFLGKLNNSLYQSLTKCNLPAYLRYEDRNSMAFSIETRLPFLDYRLVEFGFRLRNHLKLGGGVSKRIVREAMQGVIPSGVLGRRDKLGFVTPEDKWLTSNLRNNMQKILSDKNDMMTEYINKPSAAEIYTKYCGGELNLRQILWRIFNLNIWLNQKG